MNANDLLTALRGHETVTFEIRNLGSTTHETKEFEEAISEIEHALSRSRIRNTAIEPPRLEDGDKRGFILAWCEDVSNNCDSRWSFEPYRYVTTDTAKIFPKWTQLPETKGDEV